MSNLFESMPYTEKKNSWKKTTNCALIIAILAVATLMAGLPAVGAHTPSWNVPTYAYITAQPNPIGINQQAFLVFWLDLPPPTAAGQGGDLWHDFTIKVTTPSGKTENLGPFTSDPTGGTFSQYTPKEIGVYTFSLHYSGQVLSLANPITGINGSNSPYIGDNFLPSDASCKLSVQQAPIEKIPASPLPSEYWTRPINQENSNWANIASNWVGLFQTYRVQDDGIAPNSPHIMWTMPIEFGGILGGKNTAIAETGYYTGMSYEIRFTNALILQGRVYFNMPLHDDPSAGPYTCVDLATGQILWQKQGIAPTFASLYDYESPNQHGVIPSGALYQTVGSTWMAFDPFTGVWMYNFTNVPSGTNVLQNDGTIARYILNYNTTSKSGWLAKWTTAALPTGPLVLTPGTITDSYQYRPLGKNANMANNYEWNKTINFDLTGSTSPAIVQVLPGDIILGRSSNIGITSVWRGTDDPWTMWAISDKTDTRGQLVWKKSYPAPSGNISQMLTYVPIDKVNRAITMTYFETGQRLGYSLDTGTLLWGPVGTPYQVDHAYQYFSSRQGQNAYGEHIVGGYGGEVFAYDTKNGTKLWNFNDTSHGIESPWGLIPTFPSMVADGKIFAVGGEHSPNVPLYKNERLYAIDASTGREVWNITSWSACGLGEGQANIYVADGYLLYYNLYDGQIYNIGRGPSATTVMAPQLAATVGSNVMLTGSVTDQSPGAKDKAAVSDAYMTPWMEYLYMQKPIPANALGVTVKLSVTNPDGSKTDIGQTTTDLKGNYGLMWKPTTAGKYTITATFEGTNSYWPSYDTAYLAVDAAPSASPVVTTTPTQTIAPTSTPSTPTPSAAPQPTGGIPVATYIAISAVVVIIVVVAAAIILRRRK